MTDANILTGVKNALGITGNFMDDTLNVYIDEVTSYMSNAGVTDSNIVASVGVIARGVNDLWNNNAGAGKLSPYFYDRVTQLAMRS
ncbi:MAG: phage head-tail connector protein [Neisseriaceae bacterium]|nr:phage head-tail connector protein [Neisseriaceae bacterium]